MVVSRGVGAGGYVGSGSEASRARYGRLSKPADKGIIYLQGSHSLADVIVTDPDLGPIVQLLGDSGFRVACGDMSQTTSQGTFGNDLAQTRAGQLRTWLQNTVGAAAGKVHIFAGSGGCAAALNYARQNPANVASLVLSGPLVDLQDVHDNRVDAVITQAEIHKAYNNGVDDGGTAYAAGLATHSPTLAADKTPLAGIPMLLIYATNDPYIPVQVVTDYRDKIIAAGGSCSLLNLGAVGHSITGLDPIAVRDFFQAH